MIYPIYELVVVIFNLFLFVGFFFFFGGCCCFGVVFFAGGGGVILGFFACLFVCLFSKAVVF